MHNPTKTNKCVGFFFLYKEYIMERKLPQVIAVDPKSPSYSAAMIVSAHLF